MPRNGRRVVCALREVMDTFSPTRRFSNVDLPTFGLPTTAIWPQRWDHWLSHIRLLLVQHRVGRLLLGRTPRRATANGLPDPPGHTAANGEHLRVGFAVNTFDAIGWQRQMLGLHELPQAVFASLPPSRGLTWAIRVAYKRLIAACAASKPESSRIAPKWLPKHRQAWTAALVRRSSLHPHRCEYAAKCPGVAPVSARLAG